MSDPANARSIAIAGAGIGGLTAALTLARAGRNAHVFEQAEFLTEIGAGIQLGPNVTRLLQSLGVLETLSESAFMPEAVLMIDAASGTEMARVALGKTIEARHGAPYLTLHRADLQRTLLEAVQDHAAARVTPGAKITEAAFQPDGLTIATESGDRHEVEALIGADGLWSTVRGLIDTAPAPRRTAHEACRALIPMQDVPPPFDRPVTGVWLAPGAHLVHYPVRGGEALNVVAIVPEDAGNADARVRGSNGWDAPAEARELSLRVQRWPACVHDLIAAAPRWRRWDIHAMAPLPRWTKGRMTLLGDAAHPILPYLAQGGAMAIEDAVLLGTLLASGRAPVAERLRAYETHRKPRVTRVQRESARMGAIYHMRGLKRWGRDLVLRRSTPDKLLARLDWLYGFVASAAR